MQERARQSRHRDGGLLSFLLLFRRLRNIAVSFGFCVSISSPSLRPGPKPFCLKLLTKDIVVKYSIKIATMVILIIYKLIK